MLINTNKVGLPKKHKSCEFVSYNSTLLIPSAHVQVLYVVRFTLNVNFPNLNK